MAQFGSRVRRRPPVGRRWHDGCGRDAHERGAGIQVLLVAGATATVSAAIGWDLSGAEHPTHAAVLLFVAAVTALLRIRLSGHDSGLLGTVAGIVILQPPLHVVSENLGAGAAAGSDSSVGHLLVSDGPVAGMQVALSIAIVAAAAVLAKCTLGGSGRTCSGRRSRRPHRPARPAPGAAPRRAGALDRCPLARIVQPGRHRVCRCGCAGSVPSPAAYGLTKQARPARQPTDTHANSMETALRNRSARRTLDHPAGDADSSGSSRPPTIPSATAPAAHT
jgi:hypothetical protein